MFWIISCFLDKVSLFWIFFEIIRASSCHESWFIWLGFGLTTQWPSFSPKMDLTFNTKTMWNFRPSKCLYTIFHSFIENLCRCLLKVVFTMNWNGQTSEAYMAFIFESIFFFWGKYSPQYMYYHKYFYRNRTIKGHSHN